MRDRETIDSELRLIALRRRSIREQGGQPSCRQADELLDEWLAHRAGASETEVVAAGETSVVPDIWSQCDEILSQCDETDATKPDGRKGVLRRFGPLAALPLSLLAVAAVLVVMFGVHEPQTAQPAMVPPPSGAEPSAGAPPGPAAPPSPAAPEAHAPPLEIVDRAFIDVLKQDGVPVPSNEYVTAHGHAVCDFLTQQPNFAEAVRFVQQSSIWDANQSANFAAGAVVSYCPQYHPVSPQVTQPGVENALTDLEAIERQLQRIQGDLRGIQGDLPAIPSHQ